MAYYQVNVTGSELDRMVEFALNKVAPVFSQQSTYNIGDFVIYNGLLYQCITAITVASAWDASKWQLQKVFDNDGFAIINSGTSES